MELTELHKHKGDVRGEYLELDYLIAHKGFLFASTGASVAWVELDFPGGYYDPETFLPVDVPTLQPAEKFGAKLLEWVSRDYSDLSEYFESFSSKAVAIKNHVTHEKRNVFAYEYDLFDADLLQARVSLYVPSYKNNDIGMLIGDGFIQLSWGFQRSDRTRF